MSELALTLPPVSPPPAHAGVVVAFDGALRDAERAVDEGRFADALALLEARRQAGPSPELALRALLLEAWARMMSGDLARALDVAERARELSERPELSDLDRADALYHLGCCRFKRADVAVASALFSVALDLCERSGRPCARLQAHLLEWRSRCHQHGRDWVAARADVERALELAAGLGDPATLAHVHFQAAVIAERTSQWHMARYYADEARAGYEAAGDGVMLARALNNLGAFAFLAGDVDGAVGHLTESAAVADAIGSEADAARALSSLAQVLLRTGDPAAAEERARVAIERLAGREDFLDELGSAQLVLARSLVAQGRDADAETWFSAADWSYERVGSVAHRAAVWMAAAELAQARGRWEAAALQFRRAAEALQDVHF